MPLILLLLAALVARSAPASPEEKRANFRWCIALALRGNFPPSETGLHNETLEALENLATAAGDGQPTDVLAAAARAAFEAEMEDR